MKVHGLFDPPVDPGISFVNEESLTQQHFANEADINHIMARYERTGVLVDPLHVAMRTPMYGEFSTSVEYQEALNMIINAQEAFDELPATVRKRFNNDPVEMLAFLEDVTNRDEAVRLGIVQAEEKEITKQADEVGA